MRGEVMEGRGRGSNKRRLRGGRGRGWKNRDWKRKGGKDDEGKQKGHGRGRGE